MLNRLKAAIKTDKGKAKVQQDTDTIALVDVDDTASLVSFLIDYSENERLTLEEAVNRIAKQIRDQPDGKGLNMELLNSYKDAGIKDMYLFTDMNVTANEMLARLAIIKLLEEEGFKVHGVITPQDFSWSVRSDSSLDAMYKVKGSDELTRVSNDMQRLSKDIEDLSIKIAGEEDTQKRARLEEQLKSSKQQLETLRSELQTTVDNVEPFKEMYPKLISDIKSKPPVKPGQAFEDAKKRLEHSVAPQTVAGRGYALQALDEKGGYCKQLVKCQAQLEGLEHEKGKMFEQFLEFNARQQSEPGQSESKRFKRCVVSDDRPAALQAVRQVAKRHPNKDMHVVTMHVNTMKRSRNQKENKKTQEDFHKEIQYGLSLDPKKEATDAKAAKREKSDGLMAKFRKSKKSGYQKSHHDSIELSTAEQKDMKENSVSLAELKQKTQQRTKFQKFKESLESLKPGRK